MKGLEDLTLKQVTDFLIDNIAKERGISKALARKLFTNALTYNSVVAEINLQIAFFIAMEDEEEDEEVEPYFSNKIVPMIKNKTPQK